MGLFGRLLERTLAKLLWAPSGSPHLPDGPLVGLLAGREGDANDQEGALISSLNAVPFPSRKVLFEGFEEPS